MTKSLTLVAVGAIIIAIILGPIYLINIGNLSDKEFLLLSQLQMLLSIVATWILTHLYAQQQRKAALTQKEEDHRTNLRSYARQAAEKVNNLSEQLQKLGEYLTIELQDSPGENVREELFAISERMASAIQLVYTLKSVNDTSLSDWQGVIGDLLEEQKAEKEEKEEEYREFIEKTLPLFDMQSTLDAPTEQNERDQELKAAVESLRKDVRSLVTHVNPSSIRIGRLGGGLEDVVSRCPACDEVVSYRQSRSTKKLRGTKCKSCETQLVSRFDPDKGFQLELRRPVPEKINCPKCDHSFTVELDILASPSIPMDCPKCQTNLRVRRKFNKVRVTAAESISSTGSSKQTRTQLSEELVASVNTELPPQPWPKKIHEEIATKLELSKTVVKAAIWQLIHSGERLPQINGIVYVQDKDYGKKQEDQEVQPGSEGDG